MNRNRTKLRLRKQVLISFPLAIIISVLAVLLVVAIILRKKFKK